MPVITPLVASGSQTGVTSASYVAVAETGALSNGVPYLVLWTVNGICTNNTGSFTEVNAQFGSTQYGYAKNRPDYTGAPHGGATGAHSSSFVIVTGDGSSTFSVNVRRGGAPGSATHSAYGTIVAIPIGDLTQGTHYWYSATANSETLTTPSAGSGWSELSSNGVQFSAPNTGNYLVLSSIEFEHASGAGTSDDGRFRTRRTDDVGGSPTYYNLNEQSGGDPGPEYALAATASNPDELGSSWRQHDVVSLTSGTTYRFAPEYEGVTGGGNTGYRRSRVAVFDLDHWPDFGFDRDFDAEQQVAPGPASFGPATVASVGSARTRVYLATVSAQNNFSWWRGYFVIGGSTQLPSSSGFGQICHDNGVGAANDYVPITGLHYETALTAARSVEFDIYHDNADCPFGDDRGDSPSGTDEGNASTIIIWGMEHSVSGTTTLTPSTALAVAAGQAPTVSPGASTRTASPASTVATVQAPTVSAPVTLSATLVSAVANVQAPAVSSGASALSPAAAGASASPVAPSLSAGAVTITSSAASSVAGTIAPSALPGAAVLSPGLSLSVATAAAPSVSAGASTVSASFGSSVATALAPAVAAGPVTLSAALASSVATVPTPTVSTGASPQTIVSPSASAVAGAVSPSVSPGAVTLSPTPASAVATVAAPSVLQAGTISPSVASAVAGALAPSVVPGAVSIAATPAGTVSTVAAPTVLASAALAPSAGSAVASVGAPSVGVGAAAISASAASAVASGVAPSVIAGSGPQTIVSPGATASANGQAPSLATAVAVAAAAAAIVAAVSSPSIVANAPLDATASVVAATVSPTVLAGGSVVVAPAGNVSTDALAPGVGASVSIAAAASISLANVPAPSLGVIVSLLPTPASADASVAAPSVAPGVSTVSASMSRVVASAIAPLPPFEIGHHGPTAIWVREDAFVLGLRVDAMSVEIQDSDFVLIVRV